MKLPEVSHEKDITSQVPAMNFKGRVPKNTYESHEKSRASYCAEGIIVDLKEPACSSLHINMQKQVSWVQTAPGVLVQSLHGVGMFLGDLDDPFCTWLLFRRTKTHPVALVSTLILGTEKAENDQQNMC